MNPLLLLGGGYIGIKYGKDILAKIRNVFTGNQPAQVALDSTLTADAQHDVRNLLQTIRNPAILTTASAYYASAGFPVAAAALASRAKALVTGGV